MNKKIETTAQQRAKKSYEQRTENRGAPKTGWFRCGLGQIRERGWIGWRRLTAGDARRLKRRWRCWSGRTGILDDAGS